MALNDLGKSQLTLSDSPFSEELNVEGLLGDESTVRRLREMGFVPGISVQLVGQAPFGDPLIVQVRGARIALRRGEASCIRVGKTPL